MDAAPSTPREQARGTNARAPACENCRERKTKCDRGAPCSSCVTADLLCRMTRARPEKRQRILISARYDEALESVDGRLQQLQATVNALHHDVRCAPAPAQHALRQGNGIPRGLSSGWVPRLPPASLGYRGDPSFEAQAERMAGALSTPPVHPPLEGSLHTVTLSCPSQHPDPAAGSEVAPTQAGAVPLLEQQSNQARHPMPPTGPVLKLLQLVLTEKQRFFVDVFVLDEQEFTDLCREVFFAINPYTLYTWTIVNVGLFYLFTDLSPGRYAEIGVSSIEVDSITELLITNTQEAVDSFRVCSEPSIEACQALALLGTFCIKSGQINRAWTLISSASRMCIDLGFHRLPPLTTLSGDIARKHKAFWHLYTMDTGLALTLGRTQSLHLYDIATEPPSFGVGVGVPGIPGKIYAALLDLALLEGEIQPHLFSAVAKKLPRHIRAQRVEKFRTRLGQIQAQFNRARHDPSSNSPFGQASVLLNLLLHSLVTVVCGAPGADARNFDNDSRDTHSCTDCVGAAREGLTLLVKTGTEAKNDWRPGGWARFLNIFLSLAPFIPYVVLVTHAVSEYASTDLHLLASVNSVLEPVIESSPMVARVFTTCTKLYQLAESTVHPDPKNGPVEAPLHSHSAFMDGFDSVPLSLQGSVTPGEGAASDMSLENYQMMLAGVDVDGFWSGM